MKNGVFSDDFTNVFAEVLGDLFDFLPSQSMAPDPQNKSKAQAVLETLPLGLSDDGFDFGSGDASGGEMTAGLVAIEGEVEQMFMGPGKGGGGGNNGGGGGGGKPPKEDPPVSTISEGNPDDIFINLGNTVQELGTSGGDFYFSSDGAARVGSTIDAIEGFDIALEFVGDWTGDLANTWRTALENTANFFTAFISEGLFLETDVNGTLKADALIDNGSVYWDDLYVTVSLADIATNGVLASAGPSSFWPNEDGSFANSLPALGSMTIDTDTILTLEQATLIATHEMMHVLGFGTLWGQTNLLGPFNHGLVSGNGTYTGTSANEAYDIEFVKDGKGKTPNLSVETDGGSGTAGGHWEDSIAVSAVTIPTVDINVEFVTNDFEYELMTGFIDLANPQTVYLSDTSLAVLEDLGYTVDWTVDYAYDNYDFNYA